LPIDPDATGINDGDDISNFFTGVVLSAVGGDTDDGKVYALESFAAPTPRKVFAWFDGRFKDDHWGRSSSPAFRADFTGSLPMKVEIDYYFDLLGTSVWLHAYDSNDDLLFSAGGGGTGTLTAISTDYNIKWISVSGKGDDFGLLDNLRITVVPEPDAVGILPGLAALAFAWRYRRQA
jgi:hypothetical protein